MAIWMAWLDAPLLRRLRTWIGRWIPTLCGGISLVLGLFFLVAWRLHAPFLLQEAKVFWPIKYNTALALACCGTGLLLLTLRRGRGTAWLGGLVAVFTGLTLLEHLSGYNLGIDRLFFVSPAHTGDPFPDRMAPLTTFCLMLAGTSLWLCGRHPASRGRLAVGGILGCIVMTMAGMELLGYLFGITSATGFGLFTRMSGYTAAALVCGGAGLLVWAGREKRHRGINIARWLPMTGSVSLMVMIALNAAMSLGQLQVSLEWRRHSHDVLSAAQKFQVDLLDFRRGMRGYILTGKEESLRIYENGMRRASDDVHELLELVKDNPRQEQRAHALADDLDKVLANTRQALDLRSAKGGSAAEEMVSGQIGFALISQVVADVQILTDEEQRLLVERSTLAETHFRHTTHLLIFGSAMAAVLLLLAHGLADYEVNRRRRTEEELRILSERFRLAAESSETGIWDLDMTTNRVAWDRRMYQIYGHTEGKPIAYQTWVEAVVPEDFPAVEAAFRRLIEDKGRGSAEFRIRRPDGTVRHLYMAAGVWLDEAGKVSHVVGVNLDITERKRMEAALEERNLALVDAAAAKNRFLANMSHELRTPLNCIIGFSELLVDGLPGPINKQQTEYLQDILASSNHLLQLINDVLDLAKVEAGKIELFPEKFSLGEAIEQVCAVTYPIVRKKRLQLTTEVAPELGEVKLDPKKFKQVLYNLLSNAVKFTREDGEIEIRIVPAREGFFALSLRDTGIGIRPENLPRLFREFEQLDDSSTRRYQGTGLGLALTRRIIELQGGTIEVASQFGRGTTFTVTLPLTSEERSE